MLLSCKALTLALKLLSYSTPPEYVSDFRSNSIDNNFKQIRILSLLCLTLSILSRIVGLIYNADFSVYPNYQELSLGNWMAISGHLTFYILSLFKNSSKQYKTILTLCFAFFVLFIGLYLSYANAMHNTKNTMMMLLLSIVLVGMFFVLERKEIFTLTILLLLSFWGTIVLGKISLFEKALNTVVSLLLSTLLLLCARYNYYFKSKHFIKIKQLQQKNDEIEALSRQKNEVLAYVAHDLRSPLINIQMLNDMILAEQPHLQESQLIKQCTQQSANIIDDLLDALKHNSPNLDLQTVELNSFMQRLVDKWKESTNRQVNLDMPATTLYANINPSKMERVLDNLVQNADKFSVKQKPIDVILDEINGQSISISVKDYGIGIPNNMKKHIFEQFTSAGRKGLQGEKSIGIGLHISKKIIEQHQGSLNIESEENVGTTFTILLASATL